MILNKLQQMANKVNNTSPASPLTILLLKTWTLTVPHCSINIDDEMLKRLDLNLLNQVHNDRDWTLLLSLSLALQKAKATLQLMRLNSTSWETSTHCHQHSCPIARWQRAYCRRGLCHWDWRQVVPERLGLGWWWLWAGRGLSDQPWSSEERSLRTSHDSGGKGANDWGQAEGAHLLLCQQDLDFYRDWQERSWPSSHSALGPDMETTWTSRRTTSFSPATSKSPFGSQRIWRSRPFQPGEDIANGIKIFQDVAACTGAQFLDGLCFAAMCAVHFSRELSSNATSLSSSHVIAVLYLVAKASPTWKWTSLPMAWAMHRSYGGVKPTGDWEALDWNDTGLTSAATCSTTRMVPFARCSFYMWTTCFWEPTCMTLKLNPWSNVFALALTLASGKALTLTSNLFTVVATSPKLRITSHWTVKPTSRKCCQSQLRKAVEKTNH